jgi:hypothetical protein
MIAWSWFLLVIVTGWLKLLDGYTDRMLGRLAIMVEPRIGMKAPPQAIPFNIHPPPWTRISEGV